MRDIKWLFFDIGSTLIDETECVKKRCEVIIESNNIDRQEFYNRVEECAKTDSYAVRAAAIYYGAEIPRWYGELEKLYPDTKMILEALSNKIPNAQSLQMHDLGRFSINNDGIYFL